MLNLTNINKTFNPNTPNAKSVLENLNLELKKGEFVTLIGSNGAGKSTVLNCISGNFLADSGRIEVDNQDITFMAEYKRAKTIGRLFQDPLKGTAPNMTIEENLALAYLRTSGKSSLQGIRKSDRNFFKEQLAALNLGLESRLKSKVGLLSGGQRQALTLLMATLVTPKLLLLDEHTAALDPATADKVLNLTQNIISQNQITTIMVTHNIQSALQLGSRTIMMNEGKIILDISGEERAKMTVPTLLELFKTVSHKALDNDRMLLG